MTEERERIRIHMYLKMLRFCAGYSRELVAGHLHITPGAYGHYETARSDITESPYLPLLAELYGIDHKVISDLALVDSNALKTRPPLTPSENLADFLIYFTCPLSRLNYKYLSLDEKWCVYYLNKCNNKMALLSIMSAAPCIIEYFFV